VEERVRVRLRELAMRLGREGWLDGAFNAGDLLMVHALRRLEGSGLLEDCPSPMAYFGAEARPAYQRAFAAQKAVAESGASG
jgi:glutathione S-transferase